MKDTAILSSVVAIALLAIVAILFGPIFTIWALNLIFNLSIPITFWTWLSTAWLSFLVVGYKQSSKD